MKKLTNCLFFFLFSATAFAQQPEFEGKLVYKTTLHSRNNNFPAGTLQRLLFVADSLSVYVKNGNYRRSSIITDEFYIPKDQKVYIRFKGIDTLFYRDYADDTSAVQIARKEMDTKRIAGFDCSAFVLATTGDTSRYLYASQLYANPEHTKNLLISHQNIIDEQTRSIWLESESKTTNYVLTNTCIRVQEEKVDDQIFALPMLPVSKFEISSVFKMPTFAGNGTWASYFQKNVDAKVLTSFLKVKKKETFAEQEVKVAFLVSKRGEILNVRVVNEEKIHPRLKEEAIRLVQASKWRPATVINEKVDFPMMQPIFFRVEVEQ